jgi:hypothetical protein
MDMGLFDFVFFIHGTMVVIPSWNIYVQIQYLIIFDFQKEFRFFNFLLNFF